ncbi:hypothetical protein AMATHDRAFT_49762 [Amanita thiersii Skay4041]|uniref:DUF6534 domain-containing protein n=1 Tax=Amanita thiersii Skay4041 TaxID=703135 RepID=A0A2A9NKC6_9AGAR|nr:hypothetical protein AMATHDRAFT_49762 [Amanita thiersii Skay4041]
MQCVAAALFASPLGYPTGFHETKITDVYFEANLGPPPLGFVWTGLSVVCDSFICVTMSYSLLKSNVISSQTRTTVSRLVRLMIETGTVTAYATLAAVSLSILILLATSAYTGSASVLPMIILPKVYANSILVLFNSRINLNQGESTITTIAEARSFRLLARLKEYETPKSSKIKGSVNESPMSSDIEAGPNSIDNM